MPQYHNWFQPATIGNAARRERDRQRKNISWGLRSEHIPSLADYLTIDKCIYQRRNIGGHVIAYYRLCDIARIFGLTPATVQRWFDLDMLPKPAQWEMLGCAGATIYAYADIMPASVHYIASNRFSLSATYLMTCSSKATVNSGKATLTTYR